MSTLAPCLSCNRHVRSGEACPFCGALSDVATTSPLARTSRAALFALASVACGPPAQVQPYGQPPPPPAASEDASASAPPPTATATTTASAPPTATSDPTMVAAYGASPPPKQVTPKH